MDLLKKVTDLEETAASFGFRWENTMQIMAQIQSECAEISEHLTQSSASINRAELQEEIGDLLHATFSLCVFCNFSPEETLRSTLVKFERRLKTVMTLAKEKGFNDLNGQAFDVLMQIWEEAKDKTG